jgi:cell wall-associated NlpC family hydrolase
MKKTIIFSIFAVAVSFISSVNTTFAAGCEINEVSFSPINTTNSIEGQQTTLTVKFTGCAEGIQIIPKSARRLSATQFRTESQDELVEVKNNPSNLYLPGNKTTITVKYKLYEDGCYANVLGSDCNYYVNIKHLGNTVWNAREILSSIPANQESTKNFQNGIMFASCGEGLSVCDPANNSWEFVSSNVQIKADNECNLTQNDIQFINQPFTEIGGQTIALKIKTKNKCTGIPIQVHLMSKITNQGGVETIDIDPEIEGEDYIQLIANEGKDVVINFVGHDEECSGGRNPDCHIYVDIKTNNGNLIASTKSLLPSTTLMGESELQQFRVNSNFQKGVFVADCDGACGGDDWEYKTISGGYTNSPSQENSNIGLVLPQGTYDTSSPCFSSSLNNGSGGYKPGCYELLAPIPGIGAQYTDGDGNVRDSGFTEEDGRQFVDTNKIQLGDYINQIFRIALGILMVIAVIMIIISGVEYMAVESIFGKTAAKGRITDALTGLIIGLGIFLILSTINPKLLEVNFSPKKVELKILDDIDLTGFGGDSSNGSSSGTGGSVAFSNSAGVYCPGTGGNSETLNSVARSFAGKITYRFGAKGGASANCPSGQVCVDCSGYASLLLKCSGYKNYGSVGTSNIFSTANNRIPVKPGSLTSSSFVNASNNQLVNLAAGDMLGWLAGEANQNVGHVYIYLGNGLINDSNASKNKATGAAQGVYDLSKPKVLNKANSRVRWMVRPN